MARAEPVTQEAVFAAADALAANNVKPTLEAIRTEIGGSYNTLSPLLKQWRQQQTAQATAVLEMPDVVLASVKGLASDVWRVASDEAARRTRTVEEAAEQRALDAESEVAELADVVRHLEADLANAIASHDKAQADLAAAQEAHRTHVQEAARCQAELAASRDALTQSNARNDQLQQELITLAREIASGKRD
ncbi:DNA-binding protein [Granulosicoccus sp. 3-233]|uniref:DNA-binding protein n=1 Tax=Granulosicoccus sp. 3-233 TaxID=3417969 RepID=UPI003D3483A5